MSRTALIGITLMLAACTTESVSATTTIEVTTTTSMGDSTTTSTMPTTSTSTASTTTTLLSTTTTTVLEGNWADQPVVTAGSWEGVLGWWDGTEWVQAEDGTPLPVSGGEDYQIALLGREGVTSGSARVKACDIYGPEFDFPGVDVADPDLLTRPGYGGDRVGGVIRGVAISAPWDLTPRDVTDGESHPDIEAAAMRILGEGGYDAVSATIVQVVDADLDGDGSVETIVVAEDTELANDASGVYSVVFVLGPTGDDPVVVEESIIPPSETGFPASFRVSAIVDLSGDGVMEVVLDGLAWENSWFRVFEWSGGRFEARLFAGCGV